MKGKTIRNYIFEEQIGHGAYGSVWRVSNKRTNKHLALKMVPILTPNQPIAIIKLLIASGDESAAKATESP